MFKWDGSVHLLHLKKQRTAFALCHLTSSDSWFNMKIITSFHFISCLTMSSKLSMEQSSQHLNNIDQKHQDLYWQSPLRAWPATALLLHKCCCKSSPFWCFRMLIIITCLVTFNTTYLVTPLLCTYPGHYLLTTCCQCSTHNMHVNATTHYRVRSACTKANIFLPESFKVRRQNAII